MAYKYIDRPAVHVSEERPVVRGELHAHDVRARRARSTRSNDVLVRAMDRIFILHADHEQNASTSTVRLCGSSGANPFACIAAGVACLWGPAHGGANEAALNMLEEIQAMGGVDKIGEFITQGEGQELGRQADGLRPPRLQELRPARQADARDLPRSAGRARPARRPAVQAGDGAGEDRARGRLLRRRASSTRTSTSTRASCSARSASRCALFTGDLRARAHRRLDRAVERDDRRPGVQDRPAAPAVHRRHASATSMPIEQRK